MASIHIRSAIRGLSENGFYNLSSVIHIDKRCYTGEVKFRNSKPYRYYELSEMVKIGAKAYEKLYGGTKIATDTFMEVLYRENQHEFKNYFKLKEKAFEKLYKMFGEDDDCEGQTIEAAEFICNYMEESEKIYLWRLEIQKIAKTHNNKRITDGSSI